MAIQRDATNYVFVGMGILLFYAVGLYFPLIRLSVSSGVSRTEAYWTDEEEEKLLLEVGQVLCYKVFKLFIRNIILFFCHSLIFFSAYRLCVGCHWFDVMACI